MPDDAEPRDLAAVGRFATRIREKLSSTKNAAKPHWKSQGVDHLLGLLRVEMRELVGEIAAPTLEPERVADECADVAALAMMICDCVGGLDRYAEEHLHRLKTVRGAQETIDEVDRDWRRRFASESARWSERVKLLEARSVAAIAVLDGTMKVEPFR